MFWQLVLVTLLVTAALLYLVRTSWRSWKGGKTGCGGGCGCGKAVPPAARAERPVLIPREELHLRRQDQETP